MNLREYSTVSGVVFLESSSGVEAVSSRGTSYRTWVMVARQTRTLPKVAYELLSVVWIATSGTLKVSDSDNDREGFVGGPLAVAVFVAAGRAAAVAFRDLIEKATNWGTRSKEMKS